MVYPTHPWTRYLSYSEITEAWLDLENLYPTKVTHEVLGQTYQNKNILLFKIGNPNGGRVWLNGCIHGGEIIGPDVYYKYARWLLDNEEPGISDRILNNNYTLIVPIMNADGYPTTAPQPYQTEGHRDNSNPTGGVNLNRNAPATWKTNLGSYNAVMGHWVGALTSSMDYDIDGTCVSPTAYGELRGPPYCCYASSPQSWTDKPGDYEYRGSNPGSEKETQAILNGLTKWQPKFFLDYHLWAGPRFYKTSNASSADSAIHDSVMAKCVALATARGVAPYPLGGASGIPGELVHNGYSTGHALSFLLEANTPTYIPGDPDAHYDMLGPYTDVTDDCFPRFLPLAITFSQESEVVAQPPLHKVVDDRIYDSATGLEVMWRGAGGSYLLHAPTLQQTLDAWETMYIPLAIQARLNTMRLSFRFSWDTDPSATADVLDFASMDAVIDLLAQYGIKTILDQHGAYLPIPMMPQLATAWQEVAEHYKYNPNVVAYEIANEPSLGATSYTPLDNAQGYHDITLAIRTIDPERICIWESPSYYVPSFLTMKNANLLLPNVVYTAHRWWTNSVQDIKTYGAHQLSLMEFEDFVYWREVYKVPIWLGEFGGPGGGNPYPGTAYPNCRDPTNVTQCETEELQWAICAELLWRAEEQVLGWCEWLGSTSITINRLAPYMTLLPPSNFNESLTRQPWQGSGVPLIELYITASNGVDHVHAYQIELWHNNDSVTFSAGIIIKVTRSHEVGVPDGSGNCPIGTRKSADGLSCWEDFVETIAVTQPTTITNHEGTTAYPGDWNVKIDSVGLVTNKFVFAHWQDGDVNPTRQVSI